MDSFNSSLSQFKLTSALAIAVSVFMSPGFLHGQEGTAKWTFPVGDLVTSSPAIGEDGSVYFGSRNGNLYAFNPDGTLQWSYLVGGQVNAAPLVADDGTIYAGNNMGKLVALHPDGTLYWMFEPAEGGAMNGDMALAVDGTLYAGFAENVYALNTDGSLLWSFLPGAATGNINGISVGLEGAIYLAKGTAVFALNPENGAQVWMKGICCAEILGAPAIALDGTIYSASSGGANNLVALNPDGSVKWMVSVGKVQDSLSIDEDGSILVPEGVPFANQGFVVRINPEDGSEVWRFEADGNVRTAPAIGDDGVIYVGTHTSKLFAINSDGTPRWSFQTGGSEIQSSPNIAPDGSIYFGGWDHMFYAIRSSSRGLAASTWPRKQADSRNTGRLNSDVGNDLWFAPHVYWLDDENKVIVNVRHTGGSAGGPLGRTALFRLRIFGRDGTLLFEIEDSIEPGASKNIELIPPDEMPYQGSVVADASPVDGNYLAFFLNWQLRVSQDFDPFRIGAFFSTPTEAALVHHFPAEASDRSGLGVGMQNIGDDTIDCTLDFFDSDGNLQSSEALNFGPLESLVGFFNDRVPDPFVGGATIACDGPLLAVAVIQDRLNGFPSDQVTAKGRQ